MNWSTLLRFRRNVEDLIREQIALLEWERSQECAKQDQLRRDMHEVALALERHLRSGVETVFAEQRYRWLDRMGSALEQGVERLHKMDQQLVELRKKLAKAYQARRVIELVIAKKEAAVLRDIAKREQRVMEEVGVRRYRARGRRHLLEPIADQE
ncbi:MAG: hypothetical protein D6690_06565 [Nitrospirae bacterium]|nr:MAG: hypothetical protein D6690_06565 [Nitrospirota bacterium]